MGRRMVVLVAGGIALGCAAERRPVAHVVAIAPPRTHPAQSPAKSEAEMLVADLAQGARYGDSAPPRVLYTWTQPEQIAELQKDERLLTRKRSAEGLPSLFDTQIASDSSRLAQLLRRRELSLRRFAWSNPWATLAGWKGESYGDRLVRVELKRDALVLYHDPTATKPWRVTDLAGLPVSRARALAHPDRIAAVYHVYPGKKSGANAAPFREFVLVNESMIARWEVATPAVHRALDEARTLLGRVAAYATHHPATLPSDPVTLWRHAPDKPSIADLYVANLAFPNGLYRFDARRLASLARRLDTALSHNRGDALAVTPSIHFADQGKSIAPPPAQRAAPRRVCWTLPCPNPAGHP